MRGRTVGRPVWPRGWRESSKKACRAANSDRTWANPEGCGEEDVAGEADRSGSQPPHLPSLGRHQQAPGMGRQERATPRTETDA